MSDIGRIRLEILPGISDAFGGQGSGHLLMQKNIEEGDTMGDLIRKLASEHKTFGDIIFDSKTNKISGFVAIVLNDRFIETQEGLDTKITDGDIVKLLRVIAGG